MRSDPAHSPTLRLLTHPLAAHKLVYMRQPDCSANLFRQLTRELGIFLTYEATRALPTLPSSNVPQSEGVIAERKAAVIPILRSGLTLAEGALEVMPSARVGHLGFRRTDSYNVVEHLVVLPELTDRHVILMDTVIGSGNTASLAIQILRDEGVAENAISFCSILAAPEGLDRVSQYHPNVAIYAVSIERGLDKNSHIDPGFGDANKKLFGIKD